MSIPEQNANTNMYSHSVFIGCIYALVIRLIVCPLDFDISTDLIGVLGTDTLDTLSLRWAFWYPESHFFPVGWNATSVTPNILDHLLFAPLRGLAFPLADNIWWLSQLWLSIVCAHIYGRTLSHHQYAGWTGGFTLILCDSLLRELNWGHAPQAMWWAPLCTLTLLERWGQTNERRWLIASGIALGISGWCYLYFMPFIALISLSVWSKRAKTGLLWGFIGIITVSGNLFWLYSQTPEMMTIPSPPLINGQTLTDLHSATFDAFLTGKPVDISNQISIIWMMVVCIGGYRLWKQKHRHFWMGTLSICLGAGLIAGSHLPLMEVFSHLPFMSRLLWPERFGMLIAIGIIVLVSSTDKAYWLIPLALIEFTARSETLPLQTTSVEPWQCLRTLNGVDHGAIVEIPLKNGDPLYNQQSLRQRFHHHPLVNPFILPPFVSPPSKWDSIQNLEAIQAIDGEISLMAVHLADLKSMGVSIILIDRVLLADSRQEQIRTRLLPTLGEPIDLHCAYIWTIQDQHIPVDEKIRVVPYTRPNLNSTQEPL